jgi:hypothetical protein
MVTLQQIQSIDPYEFEKLVAELWESKGYDTNVRSKSNDKAIDIDAERGGRTEKIQVKRYTKDNKIGSNEVRKYATIYQQTNANSVALVTSGEVTDPAREVAQDLGVNLTDGKELVQQLESSSVDISDYTDSSSHSGYRGVRRCYCILRYTPNRFLSLVPDAIDSRVRRVGVEAFCKSARLGPVEGHPVSSQGFTPVLPVGWFETTHERSASIPCLIVSTYTATPTHTGTRNPILAIANGNKA